MPHEAGLHFEKNSVTRRLKGRQIRRLYVAVKQGE
jgi:hypothetical protein